MDIVIATSTGGPLFLLRNDGNWNFTNVGFPAQLGLHPHPLCLVAAWQVPKPNLTLLCWILG